MYGHSLIDLLALANISVLTGHTDKRKFESVVKTLRDRHEEVDLRIETEGPRTGTWSVVQPQWVTRSGGCVNTGDEHTGPAANAVAPGVIPPTAEPRGARIDGSPYRRRQPWDHPPPRRST